MENKLSLLIVSLLVAAFLSCGRGSECADFDDCELFDDTFENCEDAAAILNCSCFDFSEPFGDFGLCILCDCTPQ
ncbi:hypothetical protein MYX76_15720 [Desulfobacterota bacterium AH_259_B03_O07]|nr:hypothetical protein [Desulfobacterota bacterium AH_259_B03_O07]